jgi:uncharacterized ferritin-like protein (DUF455 family)
MELHHWAIRILSADTLEEKLLNPSVLTDLDPGPAIIWKEPTRPAGMGFKTHSRNQKLPRFHEHSAESKRAECLHRFAGHELLAVEIMAFTLLAFPNAPKHFRKGLAHTLKEEQGHVRLYAKRLKEMGVEFGTLPLFRHFWAYVPFIASPMHYISLMSLTFEMANLDFAPLYGASFERCGDKESALLMNQILEDEISHVSFGCSWLKKWKSDEQSEWQAWMGHLPPILLPSRAKSHTGDFFEENRRMAGVPEDWILQLKKA